MSLAFGDGEATTGSCSDASPMHFTGKQHDDESNLDDFDARYYSSEWGRFISADWSAVPAPVPYANFTNPQTLNLYAIVADNPGTFADLNGHTSGASNQGPTPQFPCSDISGPAGENCWYEEGALKSTATAGQWAEGADGQFDPVLEEQAAEGRALDAGWFQPHNQAGVAATPTYKTRDEAAEAAEKAALSATDKSGRKYEYGGWILKNKNGRYTYTLAVTFKDSGHFYPNSVTVPKGFSRVADYHTHPHVDRAEGEGLSAGDEQDAYDHSRTAYEADTYSRNMYRFTPGVSAYKPNEWCCGVIGDFVTHVPQ